MSIGWRIAGLSLLLSACGTSEDGDPARPESYAVTVPIEPMAGADIQRLNLPALVLVALRRRDMADVRVFDAAGRAMPTALLIDRATDHKTEQTLPLYPVMGKRDSLQVTGVSLRLDSAEARIVGVDGKIANDPAGKAEVIGMLVDTRALRDPVQALVLDADLPKGQPISLSFQTSNNLREWDYLAEQVLFRPGDGSPVLGGMQVALDGPVLRDRYVRISWDAPRGADSAVTIRNVSAITARPGTAPSVAVTTTLPELVDAHDARFTVPAATRLVGVRVHITGSGVVPVILQSRTNSEATWQPLVNATLRKEAGAAGTVLGLEEGYGHQFKLEADKRTPGFSQPPKLELLLQPVALAVRFEGDPPYRLSAGLGSAPDNFLTAQEIAPLGKTEALAALPVAKAGADKGAPVVLNITSSEQDRGLPIRKLALWAVLALGTLVLGYAALKLLRGAPVRN